MQPSVDTSEQPTKRRANAMRQPAQSFGTMLALEMARRGVDKHQVAFWLDVSPVTVTNWISGKAEPYATNLTALRRRFHGLRAV